MVSNGRTGRGLFVGGSSVRNAETTTCTYLSLSDFSVLVGLSRDLLRDLRPLGVLDLLLDLLLLLDQLRDRDLLYFGDLISETKKEHYFFPSVFTHDRAFFITIFQIINLNNQISSYLKWKNFSFITWTKSYKLNKRPNLQIKVNWPTSAPAPVSFSTWPAGRWSWPFPAAWPWTSSWTPANTNPPSGHFRFPWQQILQDLTDINPCFSGLRKHKH